MTITPLVLSGGAGDGTPISVVATTTGAADTVHTAPAAGYDDIYIYAANEHTADVELTVEFGNATEPIVQTIPFKKGVYLVIPGWRLGASKVVKAFASVTAVVALSGPVNRHS